MKFGVVLPWVIVGVLVVLLVWSLGTKGEKPVVIERHTTDTLVKVVHDTTTITKVITVKEPADTVFITVRDSILIPVPRQEYTFSEQNTFDFRVKGFDVEFLEAKVYPKTEYRTITETKETTITKYRSSLFIKGGFTVISNTFSPKVGLAISMKGRWLISGDISLYQKRPIYSMTVGYNMLNK